MVAINRALPLKVERLEDRTVLSTMLGEVPQGTDGYSYYYAEGYEHTETTGIGWATGGYAVVPYGEAPATPALGQASESNGIPPNHTGVYLNGELVTVVEGQPSVSFFAPGGNVSETIVFVNGQPVGTVEGEPHTAAIGPPVGMNEAGEIAVLGGATYFITNPANDEDPVDYGFDPDAIDLRVG